MIKGTKLLITLFLLSQMSLFAQDKTWNLDSDIRTIEEADTLKIVGIPDSVESDTLWIGKNVILPDRDTIIILSQYPEIVRAGNTTLFYRLGTGDRKRMKIEKIIGANPATNTSVVSLDQSLFYDALSLFNDENVQAVLSKYSNIRGNKFLEKFWDVQPTSGVPPASVQSREIGAKGLGGLDVTKYADGLARFLVARTKQELSIYFFDRLKKEIQSNKDIKTFFPNTAMVLQGVDQDIYQFQRYIDLLRQNFYLDINQLPYNLPKIVDLYPDFFSEHQALRNFVHLGGDIWSGIANDRHPGDIISDIEVDASLDTLSNLGGSIRLAQLLSESLSGKRDSGKYWITEGELSHFSDSNFFKYYLGLCIEVAKEKGIEITVDGSRTTAYDLINDNYDQLMAKQKAMISLFARTTALNSVIIDVMGKSEESSLAAKDIVKYVMVLSELLGYGRDLLSTLDAVGIPVGDSADEANLNRYIAAIQSAANFVGNLSAKEYGSAIFQVVNFYEATVTDPKGESINTVSRNGLVIMQKYVFFLAQLADAETSEQVEGVISSFALPSQSYRHKRHTKFNISLNSYLGLAYWGGEDSRGLVTAPVGIGFNFGALSRTFPSLSIYGNFIDVGAISTFRFKDDESEIPKIYLKEIFSPGVHVSVGVGKSPLAINIGYQGLPILSEVGAEENVIRINRKHALTASLVVDVPLVNIHN